MINGKELFYPIWCILKDSKALCSNLEMGEINTPKDCTSCMNYMLNYECDYEMEYLINVQSKYIKGVINELHK